MEEPVNDAGAAPVIRIGMLGCGTVGSSLITLLATQHDVIRARTGLSLQITRVAVRDTQKDRGVELPQSSFTDDAAAVVADPDIDVIVEVMGGIEPARTLLLNAVSKHKPVVTANKELLANVGAEIFSAAEAEGVDVLFEAAVAGGIPLVRPMRESLLGEPVHRVLGIMNGTTNYILTRMSESGASYTDALMEAQQLGYAEADPTADVAGHDAAAKIAIIASIAFGVRVVADDVYLEGITGITTSDITYASMRGYAIKLLAIAERFVSGEPGSESKPTIGVRVHPVMVPKTHPLGSVRESFNAVFVQGDAVGDLMFYGRGAGGGPTASAVLGDVVDAAVNIRKGSHASIGALGEATFRSIDELTSAFFISIDVVDRPGVLAAIAGVFGVHDVSIASMEQDRLDSDARIVFVTHHANERDVRATLDELRDLDVVRRVGSVIRVLDEGDK